MHHGRSRGGVVTVIFRKRDPCDGRPCVDGLFLGRGATTGSDGIRHFDSVVRDVAHAHATPALTWSMRLATQIGSTLVVTAVAVCGVAFFLLWGRVRLALLLGVDMGVAIVLDIFLKDIFHRHRPEPFFGTALPHSFSYPSGHALFSICCYGMLAVLIVARLNSRPAKIALLTVAAVLVVAIGFSRVYLGVHYPSDVLGGWVFAFAWTSALLLFGEEGVAAGDSPA